jgi:hypothetical protein
MIFGSINPIDYRSSRVDVSGERGYVVIIGSSNGLTKWGWVSHFVKFWTGNVINLCLGATNSTYIAFVIAANRDLIIGAKFIILEPFVNDVSHVGNKELTVEAFRACIDVIYNGDPRIVAKTFVLLLPRLNRISNIESNFVYQVHLSHAITSGTTVLDCHPYFQSLPEAEVQRLFTDPGHQDDRTSERIARWLTDFFCTQPISGGELVACDVIGETEFDSRVAYVPVIAGKNRKTQESSLFCCEVFGGDEFFVECSFDSMLLGILHWSGDNENPIRISSCGAVNFASLRSPYLKLSSFSFVPRGSFLLQKESDHHLGVAGFLFYRGNVTNRVGSTGHRRNFSAGKYFSVLVD